VAKLGESKIQYSGAKQAVEKGLFLAKCAKAIPQGLKPTLILQHLRHD